MILTRVKYKNFKILKDVNLELKNLTLLTGVNSTGKSSVIQGLLFIKQNVLSRIKQYSLINEKIFFELMSELKLNGEYIDLGSVSDILCVDAEDDNIMISIESAKETIDFSMETRDELDNDIIKCTGNINESGDYLKQLRNQNFQYLGAERITSKSIYEYSLSKIKSGNLGNTGEYTPHYLAENKNKKVPIDELKHPNSVSDNILENTSRWLAEISNGISVLSEAKKDISQVKLSYEYEGKKKSYRPQDIGFGITYTLPIILAILKSKPGDLIIIENPESHLHPSGQIAIAKLCTLAAQNGVQIILETHSEHFLNGIRVNIKEKNIDKDNVKIYYFNKDNDDYKNPVTDIKVDINGKISSWPLGFFDEFDTQLEKLLW